MGFGRGGGRGGSRGRGRGRGRGGGRGRGRGFGRGRGRGRGFSRREVGNVSQVGTIIHAAEKCIVCTFTKFDKIPKFRAGIYTEDKKRLGQLEDVLGRPKIDVMLTFKPSDGFPLKSFKSGDPICMDPYDMLDFDRIVPPLPGSSIITRLPGKKAKGRGRGRGRGGRGGGRGRGGFRGRGRGRGGGRGRGRGGGRGRGRGRGRF